LLKTNENLARRVNDQFFRMPFPFVSFHVLHGFNGFFEDCPSFILRFHLASLIVFPIETDVKAIDFLVELGR
jgi:hypothetical protein